MTRIVVELEGDVAFVEKLLENSEAIKMIKVITMVTMEDPHPTSIVNEWAKSARIINEWAKKRTEA